jgi:hypothetical protein
MRKWGEFSEEQQEALAVTQQKKAVPLEGTAL